MVSLEKSYRHCRKIARQRARNFYYSFLLLPRDKRDAMCAIYAFMRYSDDLSDEPGASEGAMTRWRSALHCALKGEFGDHPALPAFYDTVKRYQIPSKYFDEMIDGVSSDLEPRKIETFDELYRYCYQVASVVGLTIIHIFGFHSADALPLAEKCGVAFQLTNILRDVKEDLALGRVYLPAEDLRRFHIQEIARSPEWIELLRFEGERARKYYDESWSLLGVIDRGSRASLWALITIYSQLLDEIERSGYDVLSGRIRLSSAQKLWIVLRAAVFGAPQKT
jgi:15-cis-phytoene synthase